MARKEKESPPDPGRRITTEEVKEQMDALYGGQRLPVSDIPWNRPEPPDALVELIETGKVAPCRTIDLGCGAGNQAVYLASRGFAVTGVDISARAIEIAQDNARTKGVQCRFVVADVLGDLVEIQQTFDFAYDWELLHHIFPEQRKRYIQNVSRLLNAKGRYLSVCFSERDPQFGGKGKYRETRLGTGLYFSSEEELAALFSSRFDILELRTIEIGSKAASHSLVYALMEKPSLS